MNDLSQDVWFYAQNGAKGGPVDFSSLQSMAREGKLHPHQDLIWSKGMDRWQAAGEIQGLFERRAMVDAEVLASEVRIAPEMPTSVDSPTRSEVDPYGAAEEVEDYGQTAAEVVMPGARRRSYLFFMIVFPILWLAVTGAVWTFLSEKVGEDSLTLIVSGLLVFPILLALLFTIMRLVNLGMSRWWFLGNLVPFLNLWVGYRCFACPSGYATYKKLDGVGIFLAFVYWLVMLVVVTAFSALVAIVVFHVGSEKLRDQIVDPVKQLIRQPEKS